MTQTTPGWVCGLRYQSWVFGIGVLIRYRLEENSYVLNLLSNTNLPQTSPTFVKVKIHGGELVYHLQCAICLFMYIKDVQKVLGVEGYTRNVDSFKMATILSGCMPIPFGSHSCTSYIYMHKKKAKEACIVRKYGIV